MWRVAILSAPWRQLPSSSIYHGCKHCLRATQQKAALISGAQQSNLRPVHTNISIAATDSGFARGRKPDTPLSFPQKAVTHIGLGFSLLPHTNAWDGSEKKTQLVSDMRCQWARRLSLLLLDHTSLKQVTAHTSHLSAASLWLPPSGTGSAGAREKLWHYAGSWSASTTKEKWRQKLKPP